MVTVEAEIKNVVISLRAQLTVSHAELPRWGLVVWTAGNVSARVPGRNLLCDPLAWR
jgi:L-ribulose-5-phosphate 4-epimerase